VNQARPVPALRTGTASTAAGTAVDQAAAEEFLRQYYAERPAAAGLGRRLRAVRAEIDQTGSYRHTAEELELGARVAWRNASRCIGRLYWRSLQVRDRREVRDPAGVAAEAAEHLRTATNGGRIRACHDNRVSHGWTKISRGDHHSAEKGPSCASRHHLR
jgi:nitric-oxide synthase